LAIAKINPSDKKPASSFHDFVPN
jgi:hypothetical protein